MRVARALFWIVAVSLLLSGGNGFSDFYGDRPGSEYIDENSPAHRSATRVVASVSQLNGWCLDHESVCNFASTAGHLGLELVDGLMQRIMSADIYASKAPKSASSEVPAQWQALRDASPAQGTEASTSVLDGLSDLLYDGEEELDDIG